MSREFYEALKAANVPEEKAWRAAESVVISTDLPPRMARIEADIATLKPMSACSKAMLRS